MLTPFPPSILQQLKPKIVFIPKSLNIQSHYIGKPPTSKHVECLQRTQSTYLLLTTHYFTTHYSLLTTRYLLLTTHYLLLTTYYLLLTAYYSYYSLLTTYYLLRTTYYKGLRATARRIVKSTGDSFFFSG